MQFDWKYLFESTVSQELKKLDKQKTAKLRKEAEAFWSDKWPQGVEGKTKDSIIKWTTFTYSKNEQKIPEITGKLDQSLDYIFSHLHTLNFNNLETTIEKIENENVLWHQQMAQQETKIGMRGRIGKKAIVFPDGWSWVNLDRGYCEIEGRAMGHCGNAGAVAGDTILSLRDPKNVPYATFILNKGALGEMKGRSNKKPDPSTHKYIKTLIMSPLVKTIKGGGYKPENNFDISDLPQSEQKEVLKQKPSLGFTFMNLEFTEDGRQKRSGDLKRAYNIEYMYRYMGQKHLYHGLEDFENTPEYKKFYEKLEENPLLVYETDRKYGRLMPKNEIQKFQKILIESPIFRRDILSFDFIRDAFVNDNEFFYDIYNHLKKDQKETCILMLLGFQGNKKTDPVLPNIPESFIKIAETLSLFRRIGVASSLVGEDDLPESIKDIVDKTLSFQKKDFLQTFEKGFQFKESFLKYVVMLRNDADDSSEFTDNEPLAFYNIKKFPEKWHNFVKMSILSENEMLDFMKWYGKSTFYMDRRLADTFIPEFIEASQVRSKFYIKLLKVLNLSDLLSIIGYFLDHIKGNKDLWTKIYEFLVDVMRIQINKNYDKNATLEFMRDKKADIFNLIKKATDKLGWKLNPESIIGEKTNQYDFIMHINSIDELEDFDISNQTLSKYLLNDFFSNYANYTDYSNYTEKRKKLIDLLKNRLDDDNFMSAFFQSLPPQLFNIFFQELIRTGDLLAKAINWFGDFQNLIALSNAKNIGDLLNHMWYKAVESPAFDLFLTKLFKTHEDQGDLALYLLQNHLIRNKYVRKKIIDYSNIPDKISHKTLVKILTGLTFEDEINKFVNKYYNIIKQFFDNDEFAYALLSGEYEDGGWPKLFIDALIKKTDKYEDIIKLLEIIKIAFRELLNGLDEYWEKLHFNISHVNPEKKAARLHDLKINHPWIYEKFTNWLEANDLLKRESANHFKQWLRDEERGVLYL